MSLRRVVAAAFKQHGRPTLTRSEIVAAVAIDRGWFAPGEVRRLIDLAEEAGEVTVDGNTVRPTFDVGAVTIPAGYEPPDDLLATPRPFERVIEKLERAGYGRRESVASINRLQADLGLRSDAAAAMFAHRNGVDIHDEARRIRRAAERPMEE